MTEELEKKVKPSWKYQVEDFHPLPKGTRNYMKRNLHLTRKTEHREYAIRLIGLWAFNSLMFLGESYLSDYLTDKVKQYEQTQNQDYHSDLKTRWISIK